MTPEFQAFLQESVLNLCGWTAAAKALWFTYGFGTGIMICGGLVWLAMRLKRRRAKKANG
jgi:uncharacterized membrane protein YciS (DUF1049 family)